LERCSRANEAYLNRLLLRGGAFGDRPFCRHVTFGGALLILFGICPFDGAVGQLHRFRWELRRSNRIAICYNRADQNFLEFVLHVLERIVTSGAPEFNWHFGYVGSV